MRYTLWLNCFLLVVVLLGAGCKTEFERVRTSGDPEVILGKANEYFEAEEFLKAQTLYELVISSYRGRPEAERIALQYAYTHYYQEQYVLAAYYFKNYASTYGASDKVEETQFMHAFSNYKLSPIYRLDQTYTLKAIESFQEFVNRYPRSEKVEQCNQLIDEMREKLELKDFESAKLYFDLQQYQSAIRSFDNLLIEYPDTKRAEDVRYRQVKSAFLLAKNSFVEKQQERYEEVVKRAEAFITRYISSDLAIEVQDMLNDSNKRLKDLQDERY